MNIISYSGYMMLGYTNIVYIGVSEIIFTLQQLYNYTETKPGTTALRKLVRKEQTYRYIKIHAWTQKHYYKYIDYLDV